MKYPYGINTSDRKGSALLMVLLVTALLLVLVLGFTVWVRLELRQVQNAQNSFRAKAEARLGLEIAVARLQEHLGVDARSTANTEAHLPGGSAPGTRHWTGVWDSPPASETRELRRASARHLSWLISQPEGAPISPETYAPPLNALGFPTNPEDVLLVGPGTVGPAAASRHVVVPLRAQGQSAYAYWVADESQKALINRVHPAENTPMADRLRPQTPDSIAAELVLRDGNGALLLTQAGGLDREQPETLERWNRALLSGQAGLALGGDALREALPRHFHDLTPLSSGLLVNARDGGLRKDLSIAFELDDADFHRSEFSRVTGPTDWVTENPGQNFPLKSIYSEVPSPQDGGQYQRVSNSAHRMDPVASLDASYVFRGPTWSQLRRHYRQYRDVSDPFGAPAIEAAPSMPNAKTHNRYEDYPPIAYYFGKDKMADMWRINGDIGEASVTDTHPRFGHPRPRFSSGARVPSLLRIASYYSLRTDGESPTPHTVTAAPGRELVIEQNALVTLHNPYNTRLVVPGMYLSQKGAVNFQLNVRITNDASADQGSGLDVDLRRIYQAQPYVTSRNTDFDYMALVLTRDGNANSRPIVFEPGEIKVFSAVAPAPSPASPKGIIFLKEGISGNPLDDGFVLRNLDRGNFAPAPDQPLYNSNPYYIYENQTLEYGISDLTPNGGRDLLPRYGAVAHAEHTGVFYGLLDGNDIGRAFNPSVTKTAFEQKVFWEQLLLYHSTRHLTGTPLRGIPTTYSQIHNGNGVYFFYVDLYRKPTTSADALTVWTEAPLETLTQFNSRSPIQRSEYGGGFGKDASRLPPTWELAIPQDPHTDIGPLPNMNRLAFDSVNKRAFWGNTLGARGQDQIMLYDVPTTPLLSLGALQHANIGLYQHEPEYIIGSGDAPASLPPDKLWLRRELTTHTNQPNDPNGGGIGQFIYWFDTAYLANEALWDGYFFSGAAPPPTPNGLGFDFSGGLEETLAGLPSGTAALRNPRIRFSIPADSNPATYATELDLGNYAVPEQSASDLRPHDQMARYLRVDGAFNVNSVSVPAWAAQLGSLRDAAVSHYRQGGTPIQGTASAGQTPFPKSTLSGADDQEGLPEFFNGFLSLDDAEITLLAESIVAEVKERIALHGPFRSLGQFVNRWHDDGSHRASRGGVLQNAIQRSGLNTLFDEDPDLAEESVTEYFHTYLNDQTHSAFPNPEAFRQSSAAGFGQYLTQANLLTLLGPVLTVRGDTFLIRSYGEVPSPGGGEPLARAWCEAVVKRQLPYLDALSDPSATPPSNLAPDSVNARFGREFTIVSFRWLQPDEL